MVAPSASAPHSLFNLEVEAACLSILLQFPDTWAEFSLIKESDWSPTNRPIYSVIAGQLNTTPPGSVAPMVLADRLTSYGIRDIQGAVAVLDYLDGLRLRAVSRPDASALARELKRVSVRRELVDQVERVKRELVSRPGATFEEMTRLVEAGLSTVTTEYYKPEVQEVMGDRLIEVVERRAENPVDPDQMLYQGPFSSINRTAGPIIFPGSFTTIIARTAVGKSAFGFFYCLSVAERYDLPILILDAAEMTVEQIQMRAVCCLSGGRVPLWAVRSGEWRKNPVWLKIVRDEVWPRVKRITSSVYYKNVGGMTPKEKVSFIRRFHANKVGRDRFLIIFDDYLKGVESLSKQTAEYQALGFYVGDVKTLVTDEILAGYWTGLQGNRSIITAGKKLADVNDSAEQGASISDRVIQQSTNALLMRPKLVDETALEGGRFGNMVLKKAKIREGYGKEYEKIARPIKTAAGFIENYWHMEATNFSYRDCGLHSEVLEQMGQTPVDMRNGGSLSKSAL